MWHHKVKIESQMSHICILYSSCYKNIKFNSCFFLRLVIPFWDQVFKIMIWLIPNPSFWCHSNIGSKETQMCVSNTICENKVIIKVKPKHVILFFQLMKISGVKQESIFDVTFPNSSKQFTAMYHGPKINFLNPFPQLWHH